MFKKYLSEGILEGECVKVQHWLENNLKHN